ncbi:hypothetical protein KI387_018341, partial [Taxus chinensis]
GKFKVSCRPGGDLNLLWDSLPCVLCCSCLMDTFISEDTLLRDPTRLYVPGRLYHIVERKLCRYGRFPPNVKTAVPVDGRFENVVISCNATSDHSIVWIEREAQKALEVNSFFDIRSSMSDFFSLLLAVFNSMVLVYVVMTIFMHILAADNDGEGENNEQTNRPEDGETVIQIGP